MDIYTYKYIHIYIHAHTHTHIVKFSFYKLASVRDSPVARRLVCLFSPGAVMSLSTSINSLSRSRSDILRLSAALAAWCSVCCFCFVEIVNFLSHREESGLQRTIIFRALHVRYHLSCSPCCKSLSHAYAYHCLLPERSCDTGL
jgi:hypothetical protein